MDEQSSSQQHNKMFGIDPRRMYLVDEEADWSCKAIMDQEDSSTRKILFSLADLFDYNTNSVTLSNHTFPADTHSAPLYERRNTIFKEAIEWMISEGYDFGRAYSVSSTVFPKVDVQSFGSNLMPDVTEAIKKHDVARDQNHIPNTQSSATQFIHAPYTTAPRRIWDVRSNRVIPFALIMIKSITHDSNGKQWKVEFYDSDAGSQEFWAVSHSWAPKLNYEWTLANEKLWPIPLPEGVSLNTVRMQLFAFGAKYVWVDILCLRQMRQTQNTAHEQDFKRKLEEEWKLDVPTIGNIYRLANRIVRYFNGLGHRFHSGDWDDPRHWLQRAWTLQELKSEDKTYNGGVDTQLSIWSTKGIFDGKEATLHEIMIPLWELAQHLDPDKSPIHGRIYRLAREMGRRHASNDLDKLCGLFYLLHPQALPVYLPHTNPENAWSEFSPQLPEMTQLELFFEFPNPGAGGKWFPSWKQLLEWPNLNATLQPDTSQRTMRIQQFDLSACHHLNTISDRNRMLMLEDLWLLPNVTIRLAPQRSIDVEGVIEYIIETSMIGAVPTLAVDDGNFTPYVVHTKHVHFQTVSTRQKPIPEGHYFLVTSRPSTTSNWVACKPVWVNGWVDQREPPCAGMCIRKINARIFKKISVLRTGFVTTLTGPESTLEHVGKCLFI